MNELEIIENKTTREKLINRVDVLDKIKKLILLPYGDSMTTEQVAEYYEVSKATIDSLVYDNKEELISNGYETLTKERLTQFKNICKIKSKSRQISIFKRRTILYVALLLKDNEIADKIKQELGISSSWNINLRKEIKFKNKLDLSIEKIRQVMINNIESLPHTKIYSEIKQAIINLTTYKQQYNVCNNKYRIDYYFPLLNIAVEYDENYHNSKEQIEKDKQREYEIQRYFYINKYYKDITEDNLKEWEYESLEDLYEYECKNSNICDFYSFDLTKFIRIKEKNELEGLLELNSLLLYFTKNKLDSRGRSCNYKDLLKSEIEKF